MKLTPPAPQQSQTITALSIPQVLRGLASQGKPIPTGFPPLDRQCRGGGIPPGRVVLIGGPPEAGKTTLLCQMVNHLALTMPVFCLFKDEGRDQAVVRIAQQLGYPRELLEAGDEDTVARVEERLSMAGAVMEFADPDEPGMSLEAAIDEMAVRMPSDGGPRVLAIDSVQTVLPWKKENADNERTQLIELMDAARPAAREENLLILMTSQVSRGFYQSKDVSARSNASAAFLGSSRMEFGADVAIVLHPPNQDGVSRCEVTKNRLRVGPTTPFSVRMNYADARIVEVDGAGAEEESEKKARASVDDAKRKIVETLKQHRGGLKGTALFELCGGTRSTHLSARAALLSPPNPVVFAETEGRWPIYKMTLSE